MKKIKTKISGSRNSGWFVDLDILSGKEQYSILTVVNSFRTRREARQAKSYMKTCAQQVIDNLYENDVMIDLLTSVGINYDLILGDAFIS